MPSSNRSCGTPSNSAYDTIAAYDTSRNDLEAMKDAGGKLRIQVVGLATIAEDVTPELALATIESITVLGALQASKAVKAALSDRIE